VRFAGSLALLPVLAAWYLSTPAGIEALQEQPSQGRRTSTAHACAVELGAGIRSKRPFCDVVIATAPRESVAVTIPARVGDAILYFDLHNRFTVPATPADLAQAFTRQTAVVAVVRPTGDVIDHAAVSRDYRTIADLFDRLGGSPGAPPKAIAPGQAFAVRVVIPPGLTTVGIVGVRLEEWRADSLGTWDSPGRPVAIVSNLRVEYTAR
jgi:hypothetical protein